MKTQTRLVLYAGALLLLFPALSRAETNEAPLKTPHYEISAEAGAESSLPSLARELELRFDVFNELFRFNPSALPAPLKVRVFLDPAAYNSYISARLGAAKSGAVYLHYNYPERRELVILRGSPEEAPMLAHQSFIQFLRAFIPNPPTWIREGFSIYFNTLSFDPEAEALHYDENLTWLETVKKLGEHTLYPSAILSADTQVFDEGAASGNTASRFSRDFQICSWALVSFLLNSGGDYFRTLTEGFMTLSADNTAAENSGVVMDRFSQWSGLDVLDRDYKAYLDSRRTFAELVEEGRRAYDTGDAVTAELLFMAAQNQSPGHYAPYYYLGLIYYEDELYDMAQESYLLSIEYGADEALVSYALGVNAASARRYDDAAVWLEKAGALDPARYGTRARELIERLSQEATP